ncbi:tyrosine-type recombinase/integrase [Acidicapsa dinghuensis]|uniref:Tyrosine-type recombinase/integrase n=1 Tax=Acidicapsa dinghuensis TaxID=2218256 RepID=A0ABW1ED19_9BACT|nr:tyrosine-type recombinase/integrase [Acidicapsa dinghuensis]
MKLFEAVERYVTRRRVEGLQFMSGQAVLRALCKHCGNIDLGDLSSSQIAKFTSASRFAPKTSGSKFSIVKGFVDFYVIRHQMSQLVLEKPPRPRSDRQPFIYACNQIRTLLHQAENAVRRRDMFGGETFRMILLLLYATGITHEEVLVLRRSSVDLAKRRINVDGISTRQPRSLPIGLELRRELTKYMNSTRKLSRREDLLFRRNNGQPIQYSNLTARFAVLRKDANLMPSAQCQVPRILDLRFTFAVHRLTQWIRTGKNLNDLIPALSTYMGYSTLTRAEQFLAFVPERFKEDLKKLSPAKGRRRWCENVQLMNFLASL